MLAGVGDGATSVGGVVGSGDRVGVGTGEGTSVGTVVGAETAVGCTSGTSVETGSWVATGDGTRSALVISGVGSPVEEQPTDISRPSATASPRKIEVRAGWIAITLSISPHFNLYYTVVRAVRRIPVDLHFESARSGAAHASVLTEC